MARIRVGIGISSITFTTSGAVAVDGSGQSGVITPAEAGACDSNPSEWETPVVGATLSLTSGNTEFLMPPVVTSITVNGNVYAVAGGKITPVVPADAVVLNRAWTLIIG